MPVLAPAGTATFIVEAAQLVIVAAVPLNCTAPEIVPKPVPEIVTGVVTAPEVTDKLVIVGVGDTVNVLLLLATPATVTTTIPVVAPLGTGTTIEVALQLVMTVAAVPLNVTLLVPRLAPKLVPVIVTDAPTAPLVGDMLVIFGAANNGSAQVISTAKRIV